METLVSPQQAFFGSLLYVSFLIWTLSLIFKYEDKKATETYWLCIALVLPFLGSIIYLLKHYTADRKEKHATA